MRRFLLLALLLVTSTALAQAQRNWASAACSDDLDSCREDCTMLDGTQLNRQGRLAACVRHCDEQNERCVFKRMQARRAAEAQKNGPQPASSASAVSPDAAPAETRPPVPAPAAFTQSSPPAPQLPPTPRDLPPAAPTSSQSDRLESTPQLSPAPLPDGSSAPAAATAPARHRSDDAVDALLGSSADAPPSTVAPAPKPAHHDADDSVDALLDHPSSRDSSSLQVQGAPHRAPGDTTKLPPAKKDLSQWEPDALN